MQELLLIQQQSAAPLLRFVGTEKRGLTKKGDIEDNFATKFCYKAATKTPYNH
jgi:hypothetical protein